MNILLYPLHTSALVCLLWLDGGHNDIHCKLPAQLISCLRTTVITSIFLLVTFERTLLNNILHLVSCHITARTSSCLNIFEQSSQWKHLHTRCWVHPTKSPYKQFQGCSLEGFLYLAIWQEVDSQLSLDPTFKPSRIQSPSTRGMETPVSMGAGLRQKTNSCTIWLILMQLAWGNSPSILTLLSHHVEEPLSKTHQQNNLHWQWQIPCLGQGILWFAL